MIGIEIQWPGGLKRCGKASCFTDCGTDEEWYWHTKSKKTSFVID